MTGYLQTREGDPLVDYEISARVGPSKYNSIAHPDQLMEARVDTGLQNPNGVRQAAEDRAGDDRADDQEPLNCERPAAEDHDRADGRADGQEPLNCERRARAGDDRADGQEPLNCERPAAEDRADDDRADDLDDDGGRLVAEDPAAEDQPADDRGNDEDVQGQPPNCADLGGEDQHRAGDDRAAEGQAAAVDDRADDQEGVQGEPGLDAEDQAAEDQAAEDRAGDGGPHDQDVQREPRHSNLWNIACAVLVIVLAFLLATAFSFDSERSEKEAVERGCNSQKKKLQNELEDYMATLSEMNGEVNQLNLEKSEKSWTIASLQNEVNDYKTRLSENEGEYNHLQDEYRKVWQEKVQLEQKNKAQTETIEAKTKEVDDLKAQLSEMRNERDHAKDDYGKEKQEAEKCKSKLSSETKMVQELNMKLKAAEKRCNDQQKSGSGHEGISRSGYEGIIGFVVMMFVIMGCIALCVYNSK